MVLQLSTIKEGIEINEIIKNPGEEVMLIHYIDEKVIAQLAMDFELFGL